MAFGNGDHEYMTPATHGFGACGNNKKLNGDNNASKTTATATTSAEEPTKRLMPKGLWDAPTGDPVDPIAS